MVYINRASVYDIRAYSDHLKSLTQADKRSRFGYNATNNAIDAFILGICYSPDEHEFWTATTDGVIVGWGHMAKNADRSYELAVSVTEDYQRKGIGDKLITEMLIWAKFHHVSEVYMHCIEDNKVIQHLAIKHKLKTMDIGSGERTAAIEIPEPSVFEANMQLWREHHAILTEFARLHRRYKELWEQAITPKISR